VNEIHLQLCASDDYADAVQQYIIPWVLDNVDLGDDVLEVGPGPGRTTDIFRTKTAKLTAAEVDDGLAAQLADRMTGTNVEVVHADATALPFDSGRFTAALCLTMLHHVPSADLQDKLFAEMVRVLRPGAAFAGVDSLDGEEFRSLHVGDVCVPVPPDGLADRLRAAGFVEAEVEVNEYAMRFRARA